MAVPSRVSNAPTSPTLLDRLKDTADAAAWTRFESIYGDLIVAFCRRRGWQAADAEDARQHVILKLMQSLKGFEYDRSRGRFRDYLFRVIQSVLADRSAKLHRGTGPAVSLDTTAEHQTAERARSGSLEAATPEALAGEAAAAWNQEWESFHFRRAWTTVQTQFSSQHLDVFNRLLGGDPVRRVADMFAMSEEAVHKVKQRVRDKLKEQIAVQVAEEDGA